MQKNEDVEHQYVKNYFTTHYFLQWICFVTHNKLHSLSELSNYYHMRFDKKLGHSTCEIHHITCLCNKFKSTVAKPWTPYVPPHQQ